MNSSQRSVLFPGAFTSQWTNIAGGTVHALRSRSAPQKPTTVIFIHGLVVSSTYMIPTAEQLVSLCSVYAVDLPGYGKSFKPNGVMNLTQLADALAQWLDASNISIAHFVGNSFGCQILAEFAVRHPLRVNRLILQGPTVDPAARTLWRQLSRLLLNSPRERRSMGWIMISDYWSAGLRRAYATVKLALSDKIEEKLPYIQAPVLVVRGDRDPVVPQTWAEEVVRLLPNGKLQVIPNAAHTLNYSQPLDFAAAITSFLDLR